MSQAEAYNRKKNFLNDNPDRTDGGALNSEFDAVSTSVNELRVNQALIQADDGTLQAQSVGLDQLTPDAQAELSRPGPEGPQGPDGADGPQGIPGPKGDIGASFVADVLDVAANRAAHDAAPKNFTFLATDVGLLYFKLSDASGDWSTGFVFGKGDKGDQGDQGIQGQRGLQGLRGPNGADGPIGPIGPDGNDGTVDYSRVILNDVETDQALQGGLAASTLNAATSAAAPQFRFTGNNVRMLPNNTRLRLDDGQNTPTLIDLELANVRTTGTDATNTGVKMANGADIGTLFDPAGAAAGKVSSVSTTPVVVNISGKTNLTLTLSLVAGQVHIAATAA